MHDSALHALERFFRYQYPGACTLVVLLDTRNGIHRITEHMEFKVVEGSGDARYVKDPDAGLEALTD